MGSYPITSMKVRYTKGGGNINEYIQPRQFSIEHDSLEYPGENMTPAPPVFSMATEPFMLPLPRPIPAKENDSPSNQQPRRLVIETSQTIHLFYGSSNIISPT